MVVLSRSPFRTWPSLAALVGIFAVTLIAVVFAEQRPANAQPPQAIEETELLLLREGVDVGSWTAFHWGGGTLRELLDRLIQSGCAVDADASDGGLLWEWTGRDWGRVYALLNDRETARGVNRRNADIPPGTSIIGMLDEVPRSTYTVLCVAGCGILRSGEDVVSRLEDCPSQFSRYDITSAADVRDGWVEDGEGVPIPRPFVAPSGAGTTAESLCWPLDHSLLENWRLHLALPYFAVHPGTCLLREDGTTGESGVAGGAAWPHPEAPPVLALYERDEGPPPVGSELNDIPLSVTVHEYCHANQFWHIQRSSRNVPQNVPQEERFLIPAAPAKYDWSSALWAYGTPAGRAFVRATDMDWSDNDGWTVRSWPYRVMYNRDPLELAAEVCVEYYARLLEVDSGYAWHTWDSTAVNEDGGRPGKFVSRTDQQGDAVRFDWDSSAVLTSKVMQWLNDYVLLPHVDLGSGRRSTDLGPCQEDMRVGLGQSCSVPGALAAFSVPNGRSGAAWSPCDQREAFDLNDARIKVEVERAGACGRLPVGWTFQAERVGDAWFVRVVGQWRNVGVCHRGTVVEPGEYCTVPSLQTNRAPTQFRVYAVDELNQYDTRHLYSQSGYAVLYYWPDGERPDPSNGRLHHGLVQYSAANGLYFEAAKLRYRGEWQVAASGIRR